MSDTFAYSMSSQLLSAGSADNNRLCREGGEQLLEIQDVPFDVVYFACGMDHALFYTKSGHWFGCGSNECGELGKANGSNFARITALPSLDHLIPIWFVCGTNFSAIITANGELFALGETYSDEPVKVELSQRVLFAAAGWNSLIVIPEGKGIYFCFDGDQDIQFVEPTVRFIDCAAGMSQFIALSDERIVYTWGEGMACGQGQDFYSVTPTVVKLDSSPTIMRVFASNYDSFLLDIENNLWVAGGNDDGMAGLGEIEEITTFTKIPAFTQERIVLISGGREMNYALTVNGTVFACGNGEEYKLMQNDDASLKVFTKCGKIGDRNIQFLSAGQKHVILAVNLPDILLNPIDMRKPEEIESVARLEAQEELPPRPGTASEGSKCCLLL